jgi:large repetitive protein
MNRLAKSVRTPSFARPSRRRALGVSVLVIAASVPLLANSAFADPAVGPSVTPANVTPGAVTGGVIPDGTCFAKSSVLGAAGGSSSAAGGSGGVGGRGARLDATFTVLPGQTWSGSVGGGGAAQTAGGVGGGGKGGAAPGGHAGSGGGGRTILSLAGLPALIAGGGGGGAAAHQANPAGLGGNAGIGVAAGSASAGSNGTNGVDSPATNVVGGGQGGQLAAGGVGGTNSGSAATNGTAGSAAPTGLGGNGGADPSLDSSGGGGAGYTGGGGGASTVGTGVSGAGGGGGSSWVAGTSPVASALAPTVVSGTLGAVQPAGSVAGYPGNIAIDWIPCRYDLALTKTASAGSVNAGDTVTWTVSIKNNGPDPMTKGDTIDLTDTLPAGPNATAPTPANKVVSISTSGGTNSDLARPAVTCSGLSVGASMSTSTKCSRPYAAATGTPETPTGGARGLDVGETLTIVYEQVIANTAPCATITNTATVKDRPTMSGTTDIVGNIVTDTVNAPISINCYDLAITKTASPKPVASGDPLTWTITVKNVGPADMAGPVASTANPLVVTDAFPTVGVSTPTLTASVGPAGSCALSGSTTTCTNGLPSGTTQTLTFTQNVNATTAATTVISNSASVTDPKTGDTNDSASDSSTVKASDGKLDLKKTTTTTKFLVAGETINYNIVATNAASNTLTNVSIVDPSADTLTCTPVSPVAALVGSAKITCAATHVVTQADVDAGSITNTATVTGSAPNGNPVTSTSSITTPGDQKPKLTFAKVALTGSYSAMGDILDYSLTAKNEGNVTLFNATITDGNSVIGVCTPTIPVSALAPGDSIVCAASHAVTQADLDAGSVVNLAKATAKDPLGATLNTTAAATIAGSQSKGLLVTKTTTATEFSIAGELLTFTIEAKNTGNVTLTDVSVKDPTATTMSCTPTVPGAVLAPGASVICNAVRIVTQADIDSGSYANTASASSKDPSGGPITGSDSKTVPATQIEGLTVNKEAIDASFSAVGDVVDFTIDVVNSGTVTLSNVSVADAAATLGTCSPSNPVVSLAPNATISCTAKRVVTQNDLDAGSIINTASAEGKAPSGNKVTTSDPATAPAVRNASLKVTKTTPDVSFDTIGTVLTYSITATNNGNQTITDVNIVDPKATLGTCSAALPIASFAPGDTVTCPASHVVTQADIDAGKLTNVATATGTNQTGASTSGSDSAVVAAIQRSKVTINKTTPTVSFADKNELITYSITAKNEGNTTLFNVSVTDPTSTMGACTPSVPVASLLPGESITCSASRTTTQGDVDAGQYVNVATVAGSAPQGGPVSATDRVLVPAAVNPLLTVSKTTPALTYATPGQSINYTIVAKNEGNVTLSNVNVVDPKATITGCTPAIPAASIAPGAEITCSATHNITQADLDAGKFTNKATASGTDPFGTVTSGFDEKTVPGEQVAALDVQKTSPTVNFSNANDIIDYSITVTNSGNVTQKNVNVADPNAVISSCTPTIPAASLAPGSSIVCAAKHTVTQADVDGGSVTNVATATGMSSTGVPTGGSASQTVPGLANGAIAIEKTSSTTNFNSTTNVLNYSIVATNKGNLTLSNVTVVDPNATIGTCTPGNPMASLAPNATLTCSASRPVSQADIDAGQFTNVATVSGYTPGPANELRKTTDDVIVPAVQVKSIKVEKSSPSASFDTLNQVVNFTIDVVNDGNVTLTDVNVIDANATIGACTKALPTVLAPGEAVSCPTTHTVTQADLDAGSIVNVGDATSKDPTGGPVAGTDTKTIPGVQLGSLEVTKTSSDSTFVAAGDVLHYSIVVRNSGNVTMSNVDLSDPKAVLGTCDVTLPIASFAPGQRVTCQATHLVAQADLDDGTYVNVAKATGDTPLGRPIVGTDTLTIAPSITESLKITKTTPSLTFTAVGGTVDYTIEVLNNGNVTLSDVAITDANATISTCTPAIPVATLAPGDKISCTASHVVTQADLDSGSIVNVASATSKAPSGNAVDGTVSRTTAAAQTASLDVKKSTLSTSFGAPDESIWFAIEATNNGNVTLKNVNVTDANAIFSSCTPALPVATLAPGEKVLCDVVHNTTQSDVDAGAVINVAEAAAKDPNGAAVVGSGPATIQAAQTSALTVKKSTTTATFDTLGAVIDYTITATNDGNVTLSGVSIDDPKAVLGVCSPSLPVASLAPTASISCAAKHVVTQVDIDAGSLVNVATARGKEPSGTLVVGSDSATSNAVQTAAVAMTKTSTATTYSAVGEIVRYTIGAKNDGNVTLKNFSISDPTAVLSNCSPALPILELAPGAIVSCDAAHTVVQADITLGTLTNMATGSGIAPDNSSVSASATKDLTATQSSKIVVAKTSTSTFGAPGDAVEFKITATNAGNLVLSDVSVTDANATIGTCVPALPVATLLPGDSITCSATHTVTQADLDAGSVVNIAQATSTDTNGKTVEGSGPATVTGGPLPSFTVGKSSTDKSFTATSDVLHYEIVVANDGNVTLNDVVVTDPNAIIDSCAPALPIAALAPGLTVTCKASHRVTDTDLAAGKVANVASVSATPAGNPFGSAPITRDSNAVETKGSTPVAAVPVGPDRPASPPAVAHETAATTTLPDSSSSLVATAPATSTSTAPSPAVRAADDRVITERGKPVVLDLLSNDSSGGSKFDPTTLKIVRQPAHGTVAVDPTTGLVTYTPEPGFTGEDTFEYEVTGPNGTVRAKASINVAGVGLLAFTGGSPLGLVLWGFALVAIGAALFMGSTRKRRRSRKVVS